MIDFFVEYGVPSLSHIFAYYIGLGVGLWVGRRKRRTYIHWTDDPNYYGERW